ncbi:dihydrofolate reductase family protein [Foetidibacter luteolus]|uniref:dihydrofolate reductase family protein n=1 Tax=Foetidibacter luteolus TaxID=2608880 RepID=UPI00129A3E52|nr:dihydrofolate reductase family protein [Foetidibacter luteolus]
MRALNLIAQISLDGFVAGPKGEFDNFIGGEENLAFVCSIIDDADAAMFGRVSYELLEAYWPTAADKPDATENIIKYSNWYNSATRIVLSKTLQPTTANSSHIISHNLLHEVNAIKEQQGKSILIFGSPTAVHELLNINVIDNIWLIVHPVIFGDGIPLFRKTERVTKLSLSASHQLSNGTLCNKYQVQL